MMRLEQLRHFARIAETGSFRKAAESLGLTQPSLSHSIARLEEDLGSQILVRSRRGVILTPFGELILPDVQKVLDFVDDIYDKRDRAAHREQGRIAIGTIPVASRSIVRPALTGLRRSYPDTEITIREGGSHEVTDMLINGEIDFGIVSSRSEDLPVASGLTSERLLTTAFVLCLGKDHPLARFESVSVEQVTRERIIFYREGYLVHDFMKSAFGSAIERAGHLTDSIESAKWMVASGLGITVLSAQALDEDPYFERGTLVFRPITGTHTSLYFHIIRTSTSTMSAGTRAFVALLHYAAQRAAKDPA
ncbi:MAG TPA: LysR family transcriptional regulator [Lacisediminihabitans sp.]|uniref:LysR family transcriptional regulator n=1 Tax=Lacisediminihabitans sp. TaxID=2787631 RepID=UPI002EDA282F